MKRILLLFSAIVFGYTTSSGQVIELIGSGNKIVNDSAIVVYGTVADSLLYTSVDVINTGGTTLLVRVTRIDSLQVTGSENYLCWGLCYGAQAATVWTAPSAQTMAAHDTNKTFSSDYQPHAKVGIEILKYVFFSGSDSSWVAVKYVVSPLGVEQLSANTLHISAPYPNPANNYVNFNYRLNGAQQASLKVYNTLGQCMETLPVNASNDKLSINTGGLPSGIYICKLEANGGEPVYQRLIVSH